MDDKKQALAGIVGQENILVAAKFELRIPPSPDDVTVYSYVEGVKEHATIALGSQTK